MFHVRKEHPMGCAIAAAAMITDVTYQDVVECCPRQDPVSLRRPDRLARLLEDLTGTGWRQAWIWRPRPLALFPFPDCPVAVFIQDTRWTPRYGTWIAVRGRLIHDPGMGGVVWEHRYPYRHWFVTRILRPRRPRQLKTWSVRARFFRQALVEPARGLGPWSATAATPSRPKAESN